MFSGNSFPADCSPPRVTVRESWARLRRLQRICSILSVRFGSVSVRQSQHVASFERSPAIQSVVVFTAPRHPPTPRSSPVCGGGGPRAKRVAAFAFSFGGPSGAHLPRRSRRRSRVEGADASRSSSATPPADRGPIPSSIPTTSRPSLDALPPRLDLRFHADADPPPPAFRGPREQIPTRSPTRFRR